MLSAWLKKPKNSDLLFRLTMSCLSHNPGQAGTLSKNQFAKIEYPLVQ